MRKRSFHQLIAVGALVAMSGIGTVGSASLAEPTLAEMQWHRRVLIISTPTVAHPEFVAQQHALAQWQGGDDRDVTVVRIEGTAVSGSRESAAELRERYQLPPETFSAVLIGKDGHVALRSATALSGAQLEGVIDAMPMRKAGER
jgi:hypothetical protein